MLLTPVGSAEFMAPEIVEAFIEDNEMDLKYDKRWKFGIVMQYLVLLFYSFAADAKLDQKNIIFECKYFDGNVWIQKCIINECWKIGTYFPVMVQISIKVGYTISKYSILRLGNNHVLPSSKDSTLFCRADVIFGPWVWCCTSSCVGTPPFRATVDPLAAGTRARPVMIVRYSPIFLLYTFSLAHCSKFAENFE